MKVKISEKVFCAKFDIKVLLDFTLLVSLNIFRSVN